MRPAIAIFCLIVVGVVLAAMVSLRTPHPDPLPADKEATNTDKPTPAAKTSNMPSPEKEAPFTKVQDGAVRATLDVVGRGTIEMELYPKAAPKTVAHLTELSNQNFWDNLKVHRVDDQVVQMGDPASKDASPEDFDLKGVGSHGSGKTVPLEVSAKLPNLQYTVGLARTNDPNSGDSQIYINLQDNPGFDFDYCVFGRVVKGVELVGKIQKGDVIKSFRIYETKPKP